MFKPSIELKQWLVKNAGLSANASDDDTFIAAKAHLKVDQITSLQRGQPLDFTKATSIGGQIIEAHAGAGGGNVRVKRASEMYDNTKSTQLGKDGKPMMLETGKPAEKMTQLQFAKLGAYFRLLAKQSKKFQGIPDPEGHELDLLAELCEKDTFVDARRDGIKLDLKALLNDATSGGVDIIPEWFDEMLVTYPLLSGEVFPFVDLVPIPRGNTVETASVGNPTVVWGTPEGTAMTPFDTSGLIAAIDTSIHNVTVAIEIGRDFLEDTPVNIGERLSANIGQRMANELDKVVINGNGTTQPQGIAGAAGTVSVNSENGATGPLTYADTLELLKGVGPQYRKPSGNRLAYITNDTTYFRTRNIKVDPTSPGSTDQRPIFGTDSVNSYITNGFRHAIEQNLPNTKLIFGAMNRYRMYRRRGASSAFETGGKELTLKNLGLLVVRARYGGQPVDPNAFAIMADGQT